MSYYLELDPNYLDANYPKFFAQYGPEFGTITEVEAVLSSLETRCDKLRLFQKSRPESENLMCSRTTARDLLREMREIEEMGQQVTALEIVTQDYRYGIWFTPTKTQAYLWICMEILKMQQVITTTRLQTEAGISFAAA